MKTPTTSGEVRATLVDLREMRYCNAGARAFLARHDRDWSKFLKEGITVAELQEIGDAMGLRVAAHAIERSQRQ